MRDCGYTSQLVRRAVACVVVVGVAGCAGGAAPGTPGSPATTGAQTEPGNRYCQVNLAANVDAYQARFTVPEMVNAWGIAIRPQGAGGHFWVGAGGHSYEFIGDVSVSADPKLRELFQDGLTDVTIPGADSDVTDASIGKTTGVIFNGSDINSGKFAVIDQPAQVGGSTVGLGGSARFIFVTDSGRIAAWGERGPDGTVVRVNGPAQEKFNGEPQGMQFFGVAIKQGSFDTLWAADFGAQPQIRQFDQNWQLVPTEGFVNPFATGADNQAAPGDPVPFNITTVGNRVFVTYAISQPSEEPGVAFNAGEEESLNREQEKAAADVPNKGKLAEFTSEGELVRVFEDQGRLNAPWAVAVAPADFGTLGGKVLVGNFGGAGRIAAFDDATGGFVDYLRDQAGAPAGIDGLWNMLLGNGESLGDANALYFAAGPAEEKDGLFGALRPTC
ncbi:MAG: TIGR03118 family protein [Pseudonocardiaceae bacterium]